MKKFKKSNELEMRSIKSKGKRKSVVSKQIEIIQEDFFNESEKN